MLALVAVRAPDPLAGKYLQRAKPRQLSLGWPADGQEFHAPGVGPSTGRLSLGAPRHNLRHIRPVYSLVLTTRKTGPYLSDK
jgi:hypothetical protein